jgi:acetylornithine deacetylase/succinyl-diaminopimelate desuccinylase-like protein
MLGINGKSMGREKPVSYTRQDVMLEHIRIDNNFLMDALVKMVGIDSILPHEKCLSEFLADSLKAMGVEPEWHEVVPGRPNIYAMADLGPSEKFLVFSGHSDTVGVASGWETDPFKLTERDGRLYGLGAVNMKGGLACSLSAFKALIEAKEQHGKLGRLGFAVTVDQEGHSIGAKALLKTTYGRCDAMLHAEHFHGDSREDHLPIAVTGKVLYKLTVKGRAAHAFRPHLGGINAVTDASRIVAALDQLKLREHPLLGKGTVCALKIEGGYKEYSMVVPEHCEVIITRLTIPEETKEVAIRDMQDLIESLQIESNVKIETPPPSYDPYFLNEDTPILAPFKQAYRSVIGKEPYFAGHRGVVDANVFCGEGGIPTIVFGPKGANHHSPAEYVERKSLKPVAEVFVETACRYLSK